MSEALADDRLASALFSGDPPTRLGAIAEVIANPACRLSERALAALVGCLGAEQKAVQRRAVDALAAVAGNDNRVAEALRAALEGDNRRARWCAAYTLGVIGELDLRACNALLEALAWPDGDVRWAAAELIGRLFEKNPGPVRRGLLALGSHRDHNARKMAIYCLRDLKLADAEVRAAVEHAAASPEPGVRLAVLSLLAHLPHPDPQAREIASRLLKSDPNPGVRRAAAMALGRMGNGSGEVREALAHAAHQREDAALARAAGYAIARLERTR